MSALSEATITRVVGKYLVYALFDDQTISITPEIIDGFEGKDFEELGFKKGLVLQQASVSPLSFKVKSTSNTSQVFRSKNTTKSIRAAVPLPSGGAQLELHPNDPVTTTVKLTRAVPKGARELSRLIDTANLLPGDLLLSREITSDLIGQQIARVQTQGGYSPDDAKWTHVAMYLGDGCSVVEATFDGMRGSVRVTSLDSYVEKNTVVRFRRPKLLTQDQMRWLLCIRAMMRLKDPYDFSEAVRMWFRVVLGGKNFSEEPRRHNINRAVVCSTFYADAYNEVTRRSLGEVNGCCVPAWLSCSDEFSDINIAWVGIQ